MHACKLLVISITELFILRYPRSTKNCLPVLKIIHFQRSLDILPSNCQLCHAYWNSFKSYHWHVKYHNSWYETWFQYKFSRSFSHFSYNADIVHTFMSVGVCCSREDKVWKTQNKYVPWRGAMYLLSEKWQSEVSTNMSWSLNTGFRLPAWTILYYYAK